MNASKKLVNLLLDSRLVFEQNAVRVERFEGESVAGVPKGAQLAKTNTFSQAQEHVRGSQQELKTRCARRGCFVENRVDSRA